MLFEQLPRPIGLRDGGRAAHQKQKSAQHGRSQRPAKWRCDCRGFQARVSDAPQTPPDRPRFRDRQGSPNYTIVTGEWEVGRIYETRGGPDNLRWFWSMTVNGPNFRSAGQPGRRGRSWRLEALRMCPEPNAEKCQEEPQRLQNRQLALYESRRHRLRGQRISKRLVKDQKARPPVPILCRRSVAGVSPDGGSNDSSLAGQWLTLSFSGIYVHNKVGRGMGNVITA